MTPRKIYFFRPRPMRVLKAFWWRKYEIRVLDNRVPPFQFEFEIRMHGVLNHNLRRYSRYMRKSQQRFPSYFRPNVFHDPTSHRSAAACAYYAKQYVNDIGRTRFMQRVE